MTAFMPREASAVNGEHRRTVKSDAKHLNSHFSRELQKPNPIECQRNRKQRNPFRESFVHEKFQNVIERIIIRGSKSRIFPTCDLLVSSLAIPRVLIKLLMEAHLLEYWQKQARMSRRI
jgi:hypothetical protein